MDADAREAVNEALYAVERLESVAQSYAAMRRERIATAVLAGLISREQWLDYTETARLAALAADALIAELDK